MLYQLIYRSKVARHIRYADAERIAEASAMRNEADGISGALVYTPTHFLQLLEGEKAQVLRTFDRIGADKRHFDVEVIAQGEIEGRRFAHWGMRLVMPSKETSALAMASMGEARALELLSEPA